MRSDAIDARGVAALAPEAIVISPGPCTPREAGCSVEVVRQLHRTTPMLGVCLGHQAIAAAFGCPIDRAPRPVHGQATEIQHNGSRIFAELPSPLRVGRYHSLVVDSEKLPEPLIPTAWTVDGLVMALEHRTSPLVGVQFHPESVLTEGGLTLLANFMTLARRANTARTDRQLVEVLAPRFPRRIARRVTVPSGRPSVLPCPSAAEPRHACRT